MAWIVGNSNLFMKAVVMGNNMMRQGIQPASLLTSRTNGLFTRGGGGGGASSLHTASGFTLHSLFNPAGSLLSRATTKHAPKFPCAENLRGLTPYHDYHSTPLLLLHTLRSSNHQNQLGSGAVAGQSPAPHHYSYNSTRPLHTSLSNRQQETDNNSNSHMTKQPQPEPKFTEKMTLRLVAENGFLSWTRNSYLSSAAGATMLNGSSVELIQHAGVLALVVSAMNMAWGSACHFNNLLSIRNHTTMSRPVLFLNLLGTVLHALLWLFILAYFIRFSGDTCRHDPHHHHHHHQRGQDGHHHHHHDTSSTDGA